MAVPCWICEGQGHRQIRLRQGGIRDGRRVCRVCVRRLFTLGRSGSSEEQVAQRASVWWVPEPETIAPEVASAQKAFVSSVTASLASESDVSRVAAGLGYVEMGMVEQAVQAFSLVDPSIFETDQLDDWLLSSLLSRILSEEALRPNAREALRQLLYPSGR